MKDTKFFFKSQIATYASVGTGSPSASAKATYRFLAKENAPVHVPCKQQKKILLELINDFPELHKEIESSDNKSIDLKDIVDRYNKNWL
ncbi:hypothetical protein H8B06_01890 [Sphingobacterium sp. DN00404]|uniref:Uncharacterized protein n=1 Tax=Sphingobacterium micropteri TaxID=2763501 RepID=A0ABR7YJS1_9SPHI|nr:hypothetical protein [Sphingobacterium micropteri]MBD1431562.1 hypothetical protein [Sphingobacterium micropteri]